MVAPGILPARVRNTPLATAMPAQIDTIRCWETNEKQARAAASRTGTAAAAQDNRYNETHALHTVPDGHNLQAATSRSIYHERPMSYFIVYILFYACWLVFLLTR